MEKKEHRGRFWSINAQLTLPFSLLILLVTACVILSVTVLFYARISAQNNEIIENSLELAANSVENRVDIIRKLMPLVRGEESCTRALKTGEISGEALNQLGGLYAYGLQSVFLVTTDGRVLSPAYQDTEYGARMLDITGFNRYMAAGRDEMFSAPHGFPYLTLPEDNLYNTRVSYFYALRERPSFDVYGYALVNLTLDSLFVDCEATVRSVFDRFYVIDGEGGLIYSAGGVSDPETLDYARETAAEGFHTFYRAHGENTYFHYDLKSYPDWHIVAVASRNTLLLSTRLLVASVVLIGLVGVALVGVLSAVISRRITRPLQRVGVAMASFESGNIPAKVEAEAAGEMEQMVHGFNAMLDNIRTNIDTIYREQEEKKNAEVTALTYQLQSLQNQINPHFLYNTLNVVSYLALDNRCDEIRSFIQSLNQLLRATLSNMEDTVSLDRELNFLKSYTHIMEYRYPGLFDVELAVEPELRPRLVPKLILQPMVENALLHGIFPTGRKGTVTVTVAREGDGMRFTIADDGVGMDRETLDGLLDKKKGFTSFGLNNVNDRLRLSYGPEAALCITSVQGVGTTISFRMPLDEEDME